LQHYDRLGLLSPSRGTTGARLYSTADLQALVQILALKSVGVPLRRIAWLRALGPRAMAEALEAQRRALARKQPLIDRVIFAIRNVEAALGRGEHADPAVLAPLMAALKSDDSGVQEEDQRIASEPSAAGEELRRDWRTLLTDIEGAGPLDPADPAMQELAARWDRLMTRSTGGGGYRAFIERNTAALDTPASQRTTAAERTFAAIGAALGLWAREGRGPQRP
jgi:DNA-binding transcriptional MerR regulator